MARPTRVRTPWRQRLDDLRGLPLAVVVWAVAAGASAWLWTNRAADHRFVGVARSYESLVAPAVDGLVDEVYVDLYEDVRAGQPIAVLADDTLSATLEVARATVEQLKAELEATRSELALERLGAQRDHARDELDHARLALEHATELRDLAVDEESYRLEALGLAVDLEGARLERQRVAARHERAAALAADGAGSRAESEDLALELELLDASVASIETRLDTARAAERAARERAVAYDGGPPRALPPTVALAAHDEELLLRPLSEAIRVEELRVRELEVQRRSLLLVAPISGRVRQLALSPGQAVAAGMPVAAVSSPHAEEVELWLAADAARDLRAGTRVLVARPSEPGAIAETVVRRIAPSVAELPPSLWRDPRAPEYGVAVLASGVAPLGLVPGETVWARPSPGPPAGGPIAQVDR